MIHLTVVLTAKDQADADRVRELLGEQGRRSREEPGCVAFVVYQSTSDASTFFLVETWESQEALDAHREASAFNEVYVPQVLPLVERTAHVCSVVE